MPSIHIARTHNLGLEAARAQIERFVESLKDELQIESHWSGDSLAIERAGVSGTIQVAADSVDIQIELGMALALLKDRIEERINTRLNAVLG